MTTASATRRVEILNPKGLHMRPATRFVKLAGSFRSEIHALCNDRDVNGKSILDMTTLAAECGMTLEIRAEGPDAGEAVAALAALVADRFGMHDDGDGEAV